MLAMSQNHMSLDFAVDRTSAKLRCDSLSRRICCLLKAACTSRFDLAAKRCSLTIAYGWLVGGTGAAAASDRLALEEPSSLQLLLDRFFVVVAMGRASQEHRRILRK